MMKEIKTIELVGLMRSIWSYLEYNFEHAQYFEIVRRLWVYDKLREEQYHQGIEKDLNT